MNKIIAAFFVFILTLTGFNALCADQKETLVRISEVEIFPEFLEEYKIILNEEAETAMKLEKGVISIFPMFEKENPTQIRILEIYTNRDAYESHLKTPHFQKYKTTTRQMVKSLKRTDMNATDAKTMTNIFKKKMRNE